jgi:hypothetical protein
VLSKGVVLDRDIVFEGGVFPTHTIIRQKRFNHAQRQRSPEDAIG